RRDEDLSPWTATPSPCSAGTEDHPSDLRWPHYSRCYRGRAAWAARRRALLAFGARAARPSWPLLPSIHREVRRAGGVVRLPGCRGDESLWGAYVVRLVL